MKIYICVLMAVLMSQIPYVAAAAEATARASAEMIPTVNVVEELSRAQTQAKIENILSRPELKTRLAKLGLTQDEISKRLSTLSDTELRQMASQMDKARFAGDDVSGILIIVVLVLLIIYLAKRI